MVPDFRMFQFLIGRFATKVSWVDLFEVTKFQFLIGRFATGWQLWFFVGSVFQFLIGRFATDDYYYKVFLQ